MSFIVHADCRDVQWSGDVMITDPPYRAHVHKNATSQSIGGGARHRDLAFDHLSPFLRRWTCQLAANVPRWSVIFTDVESATWWRIGLEAAGAQYIRTIPWVRWSMPRLSGDRPPQGCELLVVAHGKAKGRKHWNGPGNLTHLSHTCLRGEGKHKTEKPLDQMLDLVSWFSDGNETVIDPFTGSGTTGLAAALLGRNFFGSELDEKWASFAMNRMASVLHGHPRDIERYKRWLGAKEIADVAQTKRDEHTATVRAKLEAAR